MFLKDRKFRIPDTFIVSSKAFEEYNRNPEKVLDKIFNELSLLPERKYAIRSSTSVEDEKDFSYAGQFETLTDISGKNDILKAIVQVWKSAEKARKEAYHNHTGLESFTCAVLIQEMITSHLAGVSFSRNPVTNRNEIVIEAVEGPGEELVQKGKTPFRWRISNGKILESTANIGYDKIILEIAASTKKLAGYYKNHVDIEWVFNDKHIYYLQLRGITTRRELPVYSNKMAREMLPGQIKPLVWSINIPLVNSTWIKILSEITGPLDVLPGDLARAFYYRTYFNIAALEKIFREFGFSVKNIEFLLTSEDTNNPSFKPGFRTLRHTFRIIKFLIDKLNFEKRYLREKDDLQQRFKSIAKRIESENIVINYFDIYNQLFEEGKRLAYLNIVVPLLMQIYNKRFSSRLKILNYEYEKIDFNSDFPELENLNPIPALEKIRKELDELNPEIRSDINSFKDLKNSKSAKEILSELENFLEEFGHFSASGNDFSYPKWNEDPESVFRMIMDLKLEKTKSGKKGLYEISKNEKISLRLKKLYKKAGKYRIYREQTSSLYTFGYGLFRSFYLKLSDDLVRRAIIKEREDIFYLYRNEIEDILQNLSTDQFLNYEKTINRRKREMEDSEDYILPQVIYGDSAPLLDTTDVKNFAGVGTSSGIFKGKTLVVKTLGDLKDVSRQNVLIIPFSDVSWTPLLIRAGAIVSESGGMLSHCSIVAREIGIPALVSVENACSIGDGRYATVDGSNGILTIHDHNGNQ